MEHRHVLKMFDAAANAFLHHRSAGSDPRTWNVGGPIAPWRNRASTKTKAETARVPSA